MSELRRISTHPIEAALCLRAWEAQKAAMVRGETPEESEDADLGAMLAATAMGASINWAD
jgi:hypothetical protein